MAELVRDGARLGNREARPAGQERHPGRPRQRARHRAQVVAAPALQRADRLRLLEQAAGVVARTQHGLVRRHFEHAHREQRAHIRKQCVALRVRRHPPDRIQDRGIRRLRPHERNDRQFERRQRPHVDRKPPGRGNPLRDAQRGVERPVRIDLDDYLQAGPHHAPRNLGADRRGERALVDPLTGIASGLPGTYSTCVSRPSTKNRARTAGTPASRGPRRRRKHPQQRPPARDQRDRERARLHRLHQVRRRRLPLGAGDDAARVNPVEPGRKTGIRGRTKPRVPSQEPLEPTERHQFGGERACQPAVARERQPAQAREAAEFRWQRACQVVVLDA